MVHMRNIGRATLAVAAVELKFIVIGFVLLIAASVDELSRKRNLSTGY
jgi:hypothetical protein